MFTKKVVDQFLRKTKNFLNLTLTSTNLLLNKLFTPPPVLCLPSPLTPHPRPPAPRPPPPPPTTPVPPPPPSWCRRPCPTQGRGWPTGCECISASRLIIIIIIIKFRGRAKEAIKSLGGGIKIIAPTGAKKWRFNGRAFSTRREACSGTFSDSDGWAVFTDATNLSPPIGWPVSEPSRIRMGERF